MENKYALDTICAISTPLLPSAVGIVRVSGEKAIEISQKIFSKKIIEKRINHGWIVENICENLVDDDKKCKQNAENEKIDEVVLLAFLAPNSFTGENVVEIQTHGSPVVLKKVLELLLKNGARLAQRGEFSLRAFLNHKIDMTQAEAILDLIHAKTSKFAQSSANNLSGALSLQISEIRIKLNEILAKIIASLDFPEDVKDVEYDEILSVLKNSKEKIENILSCAKNHNLLRQGIKISLIGNVNVGKSSLFNALLNVKRAIVTDIAGTTRDVITESIDLNGISATLIDSAGIRKSDDEVEKIGIKTAIEQANISNLVLCVFNFADFSDKFDAKDKNSIEKFLSNINPEIFSKIDKFVPKIFVGTHSDMIENIDVKGCADFVLISSKAGFGIDELKKCIYKKIVNQNELETEFITNERQQECLLKAKKSLKIAIEATNERELQDLISIDIKQALLSLDEITGEVLTDNILHDIFDKFCIGK